MCVTCFSCYTSDPTPPSTGEWRLVEKREEAEYTFVEEAPADSMLDEAAPDPEPCEVGSL